MRRIASSSVLSMILLIALAGLVTMGATAGHKYFMRGQVLEVTGDMAYVCIGSKDGAKVGEELTVYRFVKGGEAYPKTAIPNPFKREHVGKVKVTEVVDEHMARATVLKGDVKVHDMVELER